jgi:UDP-N-acetylglucosamine 2-epimerase (non-hydrolysing)
MAGRDGLAASDAMARIADAAGRLGARIKPDRALLMGDRLDMLPAAMGLVPLNIPLVHLHGGELTYGAADDRARHAITKLSHLHCTATAEAAERVARMGEETWRIWVTGAPGLDSLVEAPVMSRAVFARALGLETIDGLRLVTVHPETNATEPLAVVDATLAALDAMPGPSLITAPNADPGGNEARSRIGAFVAGHDRTVFRDTLGATLYANALRHAAVMVGNSSSGLIEAALFGLPVINVGNRQDGRQRSANVRDCVAEAGAIERLLRAAPPRTAPSCLYGDGRAAPRVADALTEPYDSGRLLYKRFSSAGDSRFVTAWGGATSERRKEGL